MPWGCAEIADAGDFFEARCVFHQKNDRTGCKKRLHYKADTRDATLAALRFWLNSASTFNRQRYHIPSLRSVLDVPHLPYDVLLREQLTSKPAVVKTDDDIDAEEAVAIRARARGSGSASSAGRARGQGRGKGRGRGRGRAVQVPDDADSSEMGSASASD